MKTKPIFLVFLTFLFLFLMAVPVQAESNSSSAEISWLAKPTNKPTKTKKPKKSPTQTRVVPPTSVNTATATHTPDPAFSPTATFTASATGTATETATATQTSEPGQPAKTNLPPSSPASIGTASALPPTITLDANQTPMVAGGLKISLPTETPATPWMQTVIAAVSQTASAEYQSPTPTATFPSTATAAATETASVPALSDTAPLSSNPAVSVASQQDATPFWMLFYFLVSFGFVTVLFLGYLRLVVFRSSPS